MSLSVEELQTRIVDKFLPGLKVRNVKPEDFEEETEEKKSTPLETARVEMNIAGAFSPDAVDFIKKVDAYVRESLRELDSDKEDDDFEEDSPRPNPDEMPALIPVPEDEFNKQPKVKPLGTNEIFSRFFTELQFDLTRKDTIDWNFLTVFYEALDELDCHTDYDHGDVLHVKEKMFHIIRDLKTTL